MAQHQLGPEAASPRPRSAAPETWPYEFVTEVDDFGVRIVEISDGLLRLYGYSREELCAPEVWRALFPGQDDFVESTLEHVLSGRGYRGRAEVTAKDGSSIFIEFTATLIEKTPERMVINGRVRDVTEQVFLETRLAQVQSQVASDDEAIAIGDLLIDVGAVEVTRAGERIELTPTEFRLLLELARHPGRVLSRATLLQRVWGYNFPTGGATVNTTMMRLRDKINRGGQLPCVIETVRGFGYRVRGP